MTVTKYYQAPHAKFEHIRTLVYTRFGRLRDQTAVATDLDVHKKKTGADFPLSPATMSNAFSDKNKDGDKSINPALIVAVCTVFETNGLRVEADWWLLDLPGFTAAVAKANPLGPGSAEPGPWRLIHDNPFPALVEFRFHQPRGNDVDAPIVEASLLFGTAEVTIEPDTADQPQRSLVIAVTEARLSVAQGGAWQPRNEGIWAETTEPGAVVRRVPGGLAITGPRDTHGNLAGSPLFADAPFAFLEPTHGGGDSFTALVSAAPRHLSITDPEAPDAPSPNKLAVLARLAQRSLARDAAGNPVIAQATLRPKPDPKPDPTA